MANKSVKSAALMEEIVQRLMSGETMSRICERPDMPDRKTIYRWMQTDKKFASAYRKAGKVRAQELMVESLEIADRYKRTVKDVAADRLRINTRLKLAAVLNPAAFTRSGKPKAPARKSKLDKINKVIVEIIPGRPLPDNDEQNGHLLEIN